MKYLSYEDYQQLGGQLPEASFNLLEFKSRKQIDKYTFGRLIDGVPSEIKDDIDKAMYSLIEFNEGTDNQSKTNINSESIDGYSISYGNSTENDIKVKSTIETLLNGLEKDGIPLLYGGGVNDNKFIYYPIS